MAMRTRHLAVVSLAVALSGGCNFAVKHPAATAAIAGGSLGFGTCGLEVKEVGTCGIVGGSVALGLGLVTAVALWVFDTGDGDDHLLVDPVMNNPEDQPTDIPADQRGEIDPKAPPPTAPTAPTAPPAPPPDAPPAPETPTP